MSANKWASIRGGGGGLLRLPADSAAGGGVSFDQIDQLMGLDAGQAVASLEGDFAQGKLPDIASFSFPGPVAEAYFYDDSSVVAIQGPVGSGKTTTKMKRKLRRAVMMPRSVIDGVRYYKVLFVRENYRQLWATVIPSYLETFPRDLGIWLGGRGAPVQHHIRFEDGFGEIDFVAEFMAFGDNIGASLRGVQITDLDVAEADTNPLEILTFGVGRINRYPARQHFEGYPPDVRSYGQIDCDFNAPDEDNWTYKVFHDEAEGRRIMGELNRTLPEGAKQITVKFYRQPGFGEPGTENLQNLAPGYYETQIGLNKLAGKSDVTDRMIFNKTTYLRAGDPVFAREFSRRIHVSPETIMPEEGVPLLIGLDQGFKGAAIIAQFIEPFHWRFLAELHFPNERLFAAPFGQRLAALLETPRFRGFRVEEGWGDMAGEQGASQQAEENATWNRIVGQTAGFRVRPQRLGTNRIGPRLEAMRAAMEFMQGGQPGLIIDPSMKFFIRGMEARYVWTEEVNASGDKRKVPDKRMTEANVVDAGQYLLLSKSLPSGLSKFTFPSAAMAAQAMNQGPMGRGAPAGGLQTGFDILNPYGE